MQKLAEVGEFCEPCGRTIEWDGHSSEAHFKFLLRKVHQAMDNVNASYGWPRAFCLFCHSNDYDGIGIIHQEDCIILEVRVFDQR